MNLSARFRLTLWYSSLLALSMLLFASAIYVLTARAELDNLDHDLRDRAHQIAGSTDVAGGQLTATASGEQADPPTIPGILLSPSGRTVGKAPAALIDWSRHHLYASKGLQVSTVAGFRVAILPIKAGANTAGYVAVWQSTQGIDQARKSLLLILLATVPALLLVASVVGYALAGRVLRPVSHITQTAASISSSDLSRRVASSNRKDELGRLADTFNAMIDRLEKAVKRERRFTGDASHELRTPLAVIRAETSLALERSRSAVEYERVLRTVDQQAAIIETLSSELLQLARGETSSAATDTVVPVAEIVRAAIAQNHHKERQIHVTSSVPADVGVKGSLTLLSGALSNLIDNGIKASPPETDVRLHAEMASDTVVLSVADRGAGIDAEHWSAIFEPFYQVSKSRSTKNSHGLGLAIAAKVVQSSGGTIRVAESGPTGSRFVIELPVVKAEPPPIQNALSKGGTVWTTSS